MKSIGDRQAEKLRAERQDRLKRRKHHLERNKHTEPWFRNCKEVVINHLKRDAAKVEPNINDDVVIDLTDDVSDGMIHFESEDVFA